MMSPRLQASGFNFGTPDKQDRSQQEDDIVELKKGLGMNANDGSTWSAGELVAVPQTSALAFLTSYTRP